MVAGQGTPWTDENVYVIRDVNYENYRSSDQYRDISNARNVEELRSALATHQGAAFVNTIAADRDGVRSMPICLRFPMSPLNCWSAAR